MLLGVLLGWLGAWWRGKAFVLDGLPWGYGWYDYLNNAWMIVHRTQVGYNNFREPLHAWMVGTLGEAMGSYPDAATVLASTGVFLLVVGLGCLGRALAGPWTGALCAAAVPWTAHAADMAQWANYYGLAGCLAGASLGAGALAYRWPHPLFAALCGLLGGLAWGVDPRSLAVAAGGVLLVLVGLTRAGPSWGARALALGLLGGGLYLGPWSHDALWLTEVADPDWRHRVDFQQRVIERWISRKPGLVEVCAGYQHLSTAEVVQGPCGEALLRSNLLKVLPRHLHFGLWPGLVGLALCLLPARQGWRGSLAGLSLYGGFAGLLLLCMTMPVPDRYVSTFVALTAAAAPLGLGRLVHTVLPERWAPWGAALAMLGLGLWAWQADPAARDEATQLQQSPQRARERQALVELRQRLGPEDLYRDCTQYLLAGALLPRVTQPHPPVLRIEGNEQCAEWIRAEPPATGTRWVSVDEKKWLPDQPGKRMGEAIIDPAALLEADPRWVQDYAQEGFQLWRQQGGS